MEAKDEIVLTAIRSYLDAGQNHPSYVMIAKRAGCARDTIVESVKRWERAGVLEVTRADRSRKNLKDKLANTYAIVNLNSLAPSSTPTSTPTSRNATPTTPSRNTPTPSTSTKAFEGTTFLEPSKAKGREGTKAFGDGVTPTTPETPTTSGPALRSQGFASALTPEGLSPQGPSLLEAPPPQGWNPPESSPRHEHWTGNRFLNRAVLPLDSAEGKRVRPAVTGDVLRAVRLTAAFLMGGRDDAFTHKNCYAELEFMDEFTRAAFMKEFAALPFDLRGVLIEDGWWPNRSLAEGVVEDYEANEGAFRDEPPSNSELGALNE